MSKYEWTDEMGEISGFGGEYEQACRNMVKAGCEWLEAHPDADPRFRGMEGVTGLCLEDNDDARALSAAIMSAPDPTEPGITMGESGATGAMHHATVLACLYIGKHGWDHYVEVMTTAKQERIAAGSDNP